MFTIDELKYLKRMLSYEFCDVEQEDNQQGTSILTKIDNVLSQVNDLSLALWEFCWDYGRQGKVEGIFKATKSDVENLVGKHLSFGEILGKHSDVYGDVEEGNITLITDNPLDVANAKESGYNPLDYVSYTCSECECTYLKEDFNVEKGVCNYCDKEED